MTPFSLYAFIPLGVLIATTSIATAIALWTATKPSTRRQAMPRRNAQIVQFPTNPARPPFARAVNQQPAPRVIYLRPSISAG